MSEEGVSGCSSKLRHERLHLIGGIETYSTGDDGLGCHLRVDGEDHFDERVLLIYAIRVSMWSILRGLEPAKLLDHFPRCLWDIR